MNTEYMDSINDKNKSLTLDDFKIALFEIWKNKSKIIIASIALTFLVALIVYFVPNKYKATATLLPSSDSNGLGQYSSIASMVGISLPGNGESQEIYPDIIFSERILIKLAEKRWSYSKSDTLISLYNLFKIEAINVSLFPEIEKQKLLFKYLREKVISVDIDKKTNILTINVVCENDPKLAADIANFILGELNEYNNNVRKTKSTEEKIFLESRLAEVQIEMHNAEEDLKNFEESHRNWNNSPTLKLDWQRLNRKVDVSTTIWIELKKQYELVKLNVLREKSTIDVLDYASIPAIKVSPHRTSITLFSFVVFIISFSLFFIYKGKLKQVLSEFSNFSILML